MQKSLSMRPSAQAPRLPAACRRSGVAAPLLPAARRRAFVAAAAGNGNGNGNGGNNAAERASAPSLLLFKQLLQDSSASTSNDNSTSPAAAAAFALAASGAAALASAPAAQAAADAASSLAATNPFEGVQANSLYVTLALFLMSVPGIWSQVKRAPKSKIKRITFEVPGPKSTTAPPVELDDHARAVFRYFKRYNYDVVSTGEVITFAGVYAADRGQAAAVTLYTFFGLGSVALVLATLFPNVGATWYGLTALSPLAAVYYFRNGERREEIRVKMVAADDDATADVTVEGDADEIERLSKELGFVEKGKVRVKGILEQA